MMSHPSTGNLPTRECSFSKELRLLKPQAAMSNSNCLWKSEKKTKEKWLDLLRRGRITAESKADELVTRHVRLWGERTEYGLRGQTGMRPLAEGQREESWVLPLPSDLMIHSISFMLPKETQPEGSRTSICNCDDVSHSLSIRKFQHSVDLAVEKVWAAITGHEPLWLRWRQSRG